jgi:hypothetical protein
MHISSISTLTNRNYSCFRPSTPWDAFLKEEVWKSAQWQQKHPNQEWSPNNWDLRFSELLEQNRLNTKEGFALRNIHLKDVCWSKKVLEAQPKLVLRDTDLRASAKFLLLLLPLGSNTIHTLDIR